MRRIEINVDGVVVAARLLDEQAPIACQQLWDLLPFDDQFTHSIWSGLMIHSSNHPNLDLDVSRYPLVENPAGFIHTGDVVVWPQNGMLSMAYGSTEFRWMTGPWVVTKVAELEGDILPFAQKAGRMMWEGASPVSIRRRISQSPTKTVDALVEAQKAGKKLVEIEFDGLKVVAELYEDETPHYCKALWDALPLEGHTTITHSSGEVLHYWVNIPEPVGAPKEIQKIIPVDYRGKKVGITSVAYDPHSMRGQEPGDIVWGSTWNGIRIVYGQGRFGGPGGGVSVAGRPKLGHIIHGDLKGFCERVARIPLEGSKPLKISKYSK